MTRRDTATAPWTARTYRNPQHPAAPGNRPYNPDAQVPVGDLTDARATTAWYATHLPDDTLNQYQRGLLQAALDVLDEAVRGCERRAAGAAGGNPRTAHHAPPAERTSPPSPRDVGHTHRVLQRMLDGGEMLTVGEGCRLAHALTILNTIRP